MIHQSPPVAQPPRATRHTPIYAPGRRHPIGHVVGGAFVKYIAFSKHTLRQPRAIAFDASTLDDAERAGASVAEIHDTETGAVYTATIATIRRGGFPVRRGFGNQWALTLEHWSRNGAPSEAEHQAQTQAAKANAAAWRQAGLFGGGA
jgi:hypothetical protein